MKSVFKTRTVTEPPLSDDEIDGYLLHPLAYYHDCGSSEIEVKDPERVAFLVGVHTALSWLQAGFDRQTIAHAFSRRPVAGLE